MCHNKVNNTILLLEGLNDRLVDTKFEFTYSISYATAENFSKSRLGLGFHKLHTMNEYNSEPIWSQVLFFLHSWSIKNKIDLLHCAILLPTSFSHIFYLKVKILEVLASCRYLQFPLSGFYRLPIFLFCLHGWHKLTFQVNIIRKSIQWNPRFLVVFQSGLIIVFILIPRVFSYYLIESTRHLNEYYFIYHSLFENYVCINFLIDWNTSIAKHNLKKPFQTNFKKHFL